MTDTARLLDQDRSHLIHPLQHPVDHSEPHVWVRGEGASIWDASGREFIDGLAGLWNVNVGHGRRELAEAAAQQMQTLAYATGYAGSTTEPAIRLAERLSRLVYPGLNTFFFTSGGAESNESAFKTARFFWKAKGRPGKVKVIARQLGYHGVTLAAMSATGIAAYWKMFEPRVPNFVHVPCPYPYRFEGAWKGESVGAAAARMLEEAILAEGADTVAAFIAEPVQGAGGVIVPPDDYFPKVREICSRHDVLLIADEVITGFGRTGSWFGLTRYDIEPDILSFAKGVTSGYLPLGGIGVSDAIARAIHDAPTEDRWMHAYTYSGHPTCCAVALRNLDIIEGERLVERAAVMGALLRNGLAALDRFDIVGDVRGCGLMAAVELVANRATKQPFSTQAKAGEQVRRELEARGVFTRARGDVIMLSPPLVIRPDQVEHIVEALGAALAAAQDALATRSTGGGVSR
jgi:putrescine aminotransferase